MTMSPGVAIKPEPNLIDLLNIKFPRSQKKNRLNVTSNQRIALLNFIQENPEMITHSSTKENEAELWDEVTEKLNELSPKKPVRSWQKFWKRWVAQVKTKNEFSMTKVDNILNKFLTNINYSNSATLDSNNLPKLKKKLSYKEVCNSIEKLEKEKVEVKLELDRMEYCVSIHYNQISELKKVMHDRKKHLTQLALKKSTLIKRKNKFDQENSKL